MLVEEIVPSVQSKTLSRAQQKANYSTLDSAARQRFNQRQLDDLQKDNYTDLKIDLPKTLAANRDSKVKQTLTVRKILSSKKLLQNHIDESTVVVARAASRTTQSRYPARSFCSICGDWGKYKCARCGLKSCSQACEITHSETRCQR